VQWLLAACNHAKLLSRPIGLWWRPPQIPGNARHDTRADPRVDGRRLGLHGMQLEQIGNMVKASPRQRSANRAGEREFVQGARRTGPALLGMLSCAGSHFGAGDSCWRTSREELNGGAAASIQAPRSSRRMPCLDQYCATRSG
jgi:hypothetical protein